LEAASKDIVNGDESAAAISPAVSLCKTATAPACEAMRAFRDALLATTLIPKESSDAKKVITAEELMEKLKALRAACAAFKMGEANKITAFLEQVSVEPQPSPKGEGSPLDKATDAALAEIRRLANALDYDEAIEKINGLL
jgi:hypothetical protein